MISVCIATDISLFLEGLLRTLNEERGIVVTSKAAHADQVISTCRSGHPDVLILHSLLPGLGSAELLRRLVQRGCTKNIILFGMWEPETVHAARRLAVRSMIDEQEDAENFVRAVHLVYGGAQYYSERITKLLDAAEDIPPASTTSIAQILTPTELQIFRALSNNQTSQEIARSMFISHRTVQKHRSNMARKLQLKGNNALLAFALRNKDV